MEKRLVNVLIPVYKPELGRDDRISLSQTCRILADYPLTVVHPEGLDVSSIAAEFPQLAFHWSGRLQPFHALGKLLRGFLGL